MQNKENMKQYHSLLERIIALKGLSSNEKIVFGYLYIIYLKSRIDYYIRIKNNMNPLPFDIVVQPKQKTIADKTGIKIRTVIRCLAKLQDKGFIKKKTYTHKVLGSHPYKKSRYYININKLHL